MLLLMAVAAVTIAASAAFAPLAHWSLRVMRPAEAIRVVVIAAVATSLGCGISLSAVAISYLVSSGPVARAADLPDRGSRSMAGVPAWIGLVASAIVLLLLASTAMRTVLIIRALVRSQRLCRSLPGGAPIVYVDDSDVFTVAGIRSRVVIGTQLFNALDRAEQRVVTAHEWSHVRRRHHLYLHVIDIAAAANPFLQPARDVVRVGIERWADEDAAETVGDRDLVARALARVALVRHRLRAAAATSPASVGLAVASLQVSGRVRALLEPARPAGAARQAVVLIAALTLLVLGFVSLAEVHDTIEAAQIGRPH